MCDRCGLCCLVKLQDADNGLVVYTDVACQYLDIDAGLCTVYHQRRGKVPECLWLSPKSLAQIHWLPPTCAYRLLRDGRPLPPWHPLVSGEVHSVHQTRLSVRHIAVPHHSVDPDRLVDHVIDLAPDRLVSLTGGRGN